MVKSYLKIKYVTDFFIALIAIILSSPLFAVISIAIKIEDGGEILLRQCRTGRYGKKFICFKFRSMKSDRVPFDKYHPVIGDNNSNLTKVGKVIRKFKLDELPQFVNVLRGEMCFIGPRPLLPAYDCDYEEWQLIKFEMRPGLTGLGQVRGNGHLSIKDRMYYDAYYAIHSSPLIDFKIIFMTIAVLLAGERRLLKRVSSEDYEKLKEQVTTKYTINEETLRNFKRLNETKSENTDERKSN